MPVPNKTIITLLLIFHVLIILSIIPMARLIMALEGEFDEPILTLELAKHADEVAPIIGNPKGDISALEQRYQHNRINLKKSLLWDCGFIFCYLFLYLTMSLLLAAILPGKVGWLLAAISAICGLGAAIFDLIENYFINGELNAPYLTDYIVMSVYQPSLIKWIFSFIAMEILSIVFWRNKWLIMRFIGLLYTVIALLGLLGLKYRPLLALAFTKIFFPVIILTTIVLIVKYKDIPKSWQKTISDI